MRKLVMILAVTLAAPSGAKVWITVYRCDEATLLPAVDPNQPTVYRDIMVGTRLALIVSSDAGGYWMGRLQLSWNDEKYATVSGRGSPARVPGTSFNSYTDSCLGAAGTGAIMRNYANVTGMGLEFRTSAPQSLGRATPGDWFILDYRAGQTGVCQVALYDLFADYTAPMAILSFTHVPSRDFNHDTIVDFQDFALLASHWDSGAGADPNRSHGVLDLNGDTRVDFSDLALFSEYWLERTDCVKSAKDPNDPSSL